MERLEVPVAVVRLGERALCASHDGARIRADIKVPVVVRVTVELAVESC